MVDADKVPKPASTFAIEGTVARTECGTPLPGVRVELAGLKGKVSRRIIRTDRHGVFRYVFLAEQAELARKNREKLTLLLRDHDGDVIAKCPVPEAARVAFDLNDGQLEQSGLSPARQQAPLRPDFLPMLAAGVRGLSADQRPRAQAILDGLTCGFPPLLLDPDILDIARGVLLGRLDDIREFGVRLDQLEVWGRAQGLAIESRNRTEAQRLVDGLRRAAPHEEHAAPSHRLTNVADQFMLVAAAVRTAGRDPVGLARNLELVHQQFAVGNGLENMWDSAMQAQSGAPDAFLRHLQSFGGCEPTPRFPGGFPWPRPTPFPWPSDFDVPLIDECSAEFARLAELRRREVEYTITSVEPPRACPGEVVTINGDDLLFEGTTGGVWFNSARRGAPIWAEATPTDDGSLVVEVPPGARCGPIELNASSRATVMACGATVELHVAADTPFVFEGGETAIASFRSTEGDCIHAGDRVIFNWELCNSDEHTLTFIIREGGRVRLQTPPRASEQDHYVHILPRVGRHYDFEAILRVQGPCGEDARSIRFAVQHPYGSAADPYEADRFDNWFGNVSRPVRSVQPTTLRELVDAVLAAERDNMRVGTMGSGWSYTNCVVPIGTNRLIDTSALSGLVRDVLPEALADSIGSVLPASVRTTFTSLTGTSALPVSERLVHVEAGIKVHELNRQLDLLARGPSAVPLAMPTLGGSNGQSIAGAFSTGTHGANPTMPPIADFVRAIHLVGPGGQQWWIEPESRPITDPTQMSALKARGALDPCMRVEYSDALFEACLVSMGCAGVIYSVVLEAVEAHQLRSTTTPPMPWSVARSLVDSSVVAPGAPAPWFSETILNASGLAWMTTRTPVSLAPNPDDDPCAEADSTLMDTVVAFLIGSGIALGPAAVGLGTGLISSFLGALPAYVARRTFELSLQPWLLAEIQDEIEFMERMGLLLDSLATLIATGDDDAIATAMPRIFNVLWQMGLYMDNGRQIVEQLQNLFTTVDQRPPGTKLQKSYTAMTGQCDVRGADYRPPAPHGALERMIQSWEFALPASDTLAFVDDLLDSADRVRGTNDALILNLAIRFTAGTSASLGMQQFPRTGHVEVFTVKGMAGNPAMHPHIDRIARAHGAVPHWGQFHEARSDYELLFPRLAAWRGAMNVIALESARATGASPNTFRQRFAVNRGLLTDL